MPEQVPALAGNTAVTADQPNDLIMAILQGFGPHGTWGGMAAFGRVLTNEQIADIANYVRTAWNNHAEPNAEEWSVGNWRAMADIPPRTRQPDLICPLLGADVLRPALKQDPDVLRRAAHDRAALMQVVQAYTAARPRSTVAETIEALSSAYCRAVVGENVSMAQSSAKIANFSEQLAIALSRTELPRTASTTH
jgi:hypothetical protein